MDEVFSSRIKPKACFLVIKMATTQHLAVHNPRNAAVLSPAPQLLLCFSTATPGRPDHRRDDGDPGLPRGLRRARVARHRHRQLHLLVVRDAAEGHEARAGEGRRRRPEQPSGGAAAGDRPVLLVGGGAALARGGRPGAHLGLGDLSFYHIFCPGPARMRVVGWW